MSMATPTAQDYGYIANIGDDRDGLGDDDDDDGVIAVNGRGGAAEPSETPSEELGELAEVDFHTISPPRSSSGRSVSTSYRLRRQGLRPRPTRNNPRTSSSGSTGSTFAVQSTRRGSHDWARLIKPFVSDLAFASLVCKRFQSNVSFRPYTCHAAVLLVDLCRYSKITAAIAHRGAHFLSAVVNAYLSRLLKIVQEFGGDVVKFAGDAILVVWQGPDEEDLGKNVLTAARCALALQERAPSHTVLEGGSSLGPLVFRIHCGLTCGVLESEIFAAATHNHMQRLFHSVGGEPLEVMGDAVDHARAGEVCVDEECFDYLGDRATFEDVPGCDTAKKITSLDIEPPLQRILEDYIESCLDNRVMQRSKIIEEDFINQTVLNLLSHGGMSPTQIAQMRSLCVLFIAMTSNGSSVNWLTEVQAVLDVNRCPIVQIIDDDKGVHIVAAVNLYETVPEASMLGLKICRELESREIGCAIGMALGTSFCGVTGDSAVACRWDITGPAAVRAARLMQYALVNELRTAIDQSVYKDPMASSYLKVVESCVHLKGCDPGSVYGLAEDANVDAAFRVMEAVQGRCHDDEVAELVDWIGGGRSRCAVMVKGPPVAGKKSVIQRAAGLSDLVPYLHLCDQSAGLLQLARTVAIWYSYAEIKSVALSARDVLALMDNGKWSRAHDECIRLVNLAVEEGTTACFVVDRIQFLDEFSISLIRECLHGVIGSRRGSKGHSLRSWNTRESDVSLTGSERSDRSTGKVCFLCVHVSLYNCRSAAHIVEDITRANKRIHVPVIEVGEGTEKCMRDVFRDLGDMEVEDRWLRAYAEPAGNCVGYFMLRAEALRNLSGKLWKEGKPGYGETTNELVLHVPVGYIRKNRDVKVMQISAEVAMRFAQIFDELPPLFQTFSKVLYVATQKGFFKLPRIIMWEVLNDLIAEGVEDDAMDGVLDEMKDDYLIKIEHERDQEVVSFQCPALGEIAMDVCTPVQIRSIGLALIERLEPTMNHDFKVPLVLADLHHMLGQNEALQKHLWSQGYKALLEEGTSWSDCELVRWKETLDDEIVAAGYDSQDILGDDFSFPCLSKPGIGPRLPLVKIYSAPIAFGPMGNSLSLICRNTFHEYKIFHGVDEDAAETLRDSTKSAATRYLKQMEIVEEFLASNGIAVPRDHLDAEHEIVSRISTPAAEDSDVIDKAAIILDDYVPTYVIPRVERLHALVVKLRETGPPSVLEDAPKAIRRAYETLSGACQGNRNDAAQNALMIMATLHWKPRPPPEYLPIRHVHTVGRIRDKVLRRLNDAELAVLIHQQTVDDFEAFLVVTAILYAAQDAGKC